MKNLLRVAHLLGLVVAGSLLAVACGPAATPSPTSPPTAVPATATAVPPTVEPTPAIEGVGTDINVTLPPGDAGRGEQLMAQQDVTTESLDCNNCHQTDHDDYGPRWEANFVNDNQGIATRAETRYLGEDYTGNASSARLYLVESILDPSVYIIDFPFYEFSPGKSTMPGNYGQRLTAQDLADIIAYLEAIK